MKRSSSGWLTAAAALALTSCATIRPPQPPSLKLPLPPTDLHARRKGDKVLLSWTIPTMTTDRQTIQTRGATRICRAAETVLSECGTAVGEAAAVAKTAAAATPPAKESAKRPGKESAKKPAKEKESQSYADALPARIQSDNASSYASYAVEVLNSAGHGAGPSNTVRVLLTRTLPAPTDFSARLTTEGVVLSWTEAAAPEHAAALSYIYRVYRREDGGKAGLVGELWDAANPKVTLTDSSIEWEQNYFYRVEAVTVIAEIGKPKVEIEGEDSSELEIFTHDTFPPAVPSGLQAVFSGPGQQTFIDLIWAPVPDMDLAGYNIYRREDGAATVKVNSEPVKTPAYRDANVVAGKSYSYTVSAVDVRRNESARSEEATETVP